MIPVSDSPNPSASSRRNGGKGPRTRPLVSLGSWRCVEPTQFQRTTRTNTIPPTANASIEVSVLGRGCKCRKALLGS